MKTRGAVLLLVFVGACGGGGGEKAPTFMPVAVTNDADVYTVQLGDLKMVVDGARGAHVAEFSLFGTNVLVSRDQNRNTYGSVYWPSPQSSWCAAGGACWPPAAAIDGQPYTGGIDAGSVMLLSDVASLGGVADAMIKVGKIFTPVPEHGAVDITYVLDATTVSVPLAPWQLSRVMTGGITFFGQGTGDVTYTQDSDPTFAVTDGAGDRWYASAPVSHDSKAFADGTGWLAHVTSDRMLYVMSFPDLQPADAAPGEAEIEVYTNRDYVEIEGQGALTTTQPGNATVWTVRWKLRRLPAGVPVEAGNAALAAFTASVLAE
jgi:hypothetical protein